MTSDKGAYTLGPILSYGEFFLFFKGREIYYLCECKSWLVNGVFEGENEVQK